MSLSCRPTDEDNTAQTNDSLYNCVKIAEAKPDIAGACATNTCLRLVAEVPRHHVPDGHVVAHYPRRLELCTEIRRSPVRVVERDDSGLEGLWARSFKNEEVLGTLVAVLRVEARHLRLKLPLSADSLYQSVKERCGHAG